MKRGKQTWLGRSLAVALVGCHPSGTIDAGSSAGDCPPAWLEMPQVDRSIAVPERHGVVLHASAEGTQDYVCAAVAGDGALAYAWSLKGPDATLRDCHSVAIGHHFPSDAGTPEWQLYDGTYVVGHKSGAFAVGGAAPWLLLSVDRHGGSGRLGDARYVQRLHTVGGLQPDAACDASRAGTLQKVPYQADYVFYAP